MDTNVDEGAASGGGRARASQVATATYDLTSMAAGALATAATCRILEGGILYYYGRVHQGNAETAA